ncbi:hypothetical protein [Lactococcus taiwanensis]|uniref:hypothetical protein n=1 Tax=Lactococcus taiwanensis TaxID=1151742 RepID=UPI0028A9D579|nr:hypothetical protein [Lactococcus taiwanensis]
MTDWNDKGLKVGVKFNKAGLSLDTKSDIMEEKSSIERGANMHQETYSKNEIDLKFQNLSDKVDNKFELLSQKVDNGFSNQVLQINNSFLEFKQALKDESEKERKERQNEKKELIKWSIGTAIAIIAAVAALLALT